MLRTLNQNQAFFIALLAEAARIRPDELIRDVPEEALLGEQAAAVLLDDPDLHDHLLKGLYAVETA